MQEISSERTLEELNEAQARVAVQGPEQLKRFLTASGREFIVFNWEELMSALKANLGSFLVLKSDDLVDSVWTAGGTGVQAFQQIVAAYRDHRRTIPSGETEAIKNAETGMMVDVATMKGETLTLSEMKSAAAHLAAQIREKEPDWAP